MDLLTTLPEPSRVPQRLAPVLSAWRVYIEGGGEVYGSTAGVSDEQVSAFEAATGGPLPAELRAIYEISVAGLEFTDLAMSIESWPPEAIRDYGIELFDDDPVYDRLQAFGGDLGDNVWTFWVQRGERPQTSPVLVLVDHGIEELRSAGDLPVFLAVETAFALFFDDEPDATALAALDALGVPASIRDRNLSEDERLLRLAEWADPVTGKEWGHWHDHEPLDHETLLALARDLP